MFGVDVSDSSSKKVLYWALDFFYTIPKPKLNKQKESNL